MLKNNNSHIVWSLILVSLTMTIPKAVSAYSVAPPPSKHAEPTTTELINAVNALRLAYGIAPLAVHPILMQTAQSQADALIATNGAIGHGRPNGMTFTQQLLLLGYPLSGDLSLGGYRSENFVFGTDLTIQEAIEFWLGDEPHTNTMLSLNRNDIGAGISIANDGTVYYVIDTALHTSSGLPQSDAVLYLPGAGSGSSTGANTPDPQAGLVSQYMVPVSVSTARPSGDVLHKVQYGQTLWSIAIEYHTKINQIQALNNLGEDITVYPGQVLLVQKGATQPPPATPTPTVVSSPTPVSTSTFAMEAAWRPPISTQLPEEISGVESEIQGPSFGLMVGLVVFAVVVIVIIAAGLIREPAK